MKTTTSQTLSRVFLLAIVVALLVVTITPLLWMVATSLKTKTQVMEFPPNFLPSPVRWANYPDALQSAPFGQYFFNSFKITIIVMLGLVIISSLGGYGFARFSFPLKGVLFAILLSAMMVPYAMMLVPLYSMFRTIGWLDTHWSVIVPPMLANTFSTFLFRQFFRGIPIELDEAATMDGASPLRIYWSVLMPLSRPVIATVCVFAFMANWNSFIQPLVFLHSTQKLTVTVGLSVFQGQFGTEYQLLMAVATLALVPIFAVYIAAQKHFISGVVLSGLKS